MGKNRPPKYLTRNQRSSHKNPNVYQDRKKTCEQLRSKSKPMWQVNFDKRHMDEVKTVREKREENITFKAKDRRGRKEREAKFRIEKIHFYSFPPTIH
jgi:transposase